MLVLFALSAFAEDSSTPPMILEAPLPEYPASAEPGQTLSVRVRLTIDADGHVADATVVSTPAPGFDEAVLAIAPSWMFDPARDVTGPIAVVVELEVPFAPPEVAGVHESADVETIVVVARAEAPMVVHAVSIAEVRRIPGTFGDPVRVITSLPGAARPAFGTGALVIRGSNPEDTGIYIEGVRIPEIFHIGGFESVLAPEMIGGVDYMPGDYGVEYGRSTGGTVDIQLSDSMPAKPTFRWSTDFLDTGLYGSFSAGRHAFALGADSA